VGLLFSEKVALYSALVEVAVPEARHDIVMYYSTLGHVLEARLLLGLQGQTQLSWGFW